MDSKSHDAWIQDYGAAARNRPGPERVDYFKFYKVAAHAHARGSAKAVLWALAHRTNSDPMNKRFGTCKISLRGLMSLAGLSERTVQRAINELCDSGIVTVEGDRLGGARSTAANVYRINPVASIDTGVRLTGVRS